MIKNSRDYFLPNLQIPGFHQQIPLPFLPGYEIQGPFWSGSFSLRVHILISSDVF